MTKYSLLLVALLVLLGCGSTAPRSEAKVVSVAELLDIREKTGGEVQDVTVEGIVWPNQHGDAIRDAVNHQRFVLMPWAQGDQITDEWRHYFQVRMSTMSAGTSKQIRIVARGALIRSGDTFQFHVNDFERIAVEPRVQARSNRAVQRRVADAQR